MLGCTPTAGLEVVVPYDEAKDIMFYHAQKIITWTRSGARDFLPAVPG